MLGLRLCHCAGAVHYFGFRVVIGHTLMTNSFSSDFCSISILCCSTAHLAKQAPHSCFLPLPWQLESQPRMGHQGFLSTHHGVYHLICLYVCMVSHISLRPQNRCPPPRCEALIKCDTRPSFLRSHRRPHYCHISTNYTGQRKEVIISECQLKTAIYIIKVTFWEIAQLTTSLTTSGESNVWFPSPRRWRQQSAKERGGEIKIAQMH